jgi:hypothetical protein
MGYVVSCLKGKAHDQVSYNIKDGVVLFDNINTIKEILKSAFGDIDAQATAQLKIFDMKQGHKSLVTFLPEWHAVAKLTGWDSGALIAHLRRALHDHIIWRLSLTKGKDVPTELTQFIDLVRTCDLAGSKEGVMREWKCSRSGCVVDPSVWSSVVSRTAC